MKGWHFVRDDYRLGYCDGREVRAGQTYKVDCVPVPCLAGLHGSKRLLDALKYAPGPILCRVELGGTIIHDHDKSTATERHVLWMLDATEVLRAFARKCALDVTHFWDPPDVVLRYLKTGDASIRDAAWDAAWDAAGVAARAAAGDAAWDAARDAAWAAAWDAARDAAGDAAWDAARSQQERRLISMVHAARMHDDSSTCGD